MNSDNSNSANPYESPATVDDSAPIDSDSEFDVRFRVASMGLKLISVGAGTFALLSIPRLINQFSSLQISWSWQVIFTLSALALITVGALALIPIPRPWRWLAAAVAGVQGVSILIVIVDMVYPLPALLNSEIAGKCWLFSIVFLVWLLRGIIVQTAGRNGLYYSCLPLMMVAAMVAITETFFRHYMNTRFAGVLGIGILLTFAGLALVAFSASRLVRRAVTREGEAGVMKMFFG